MSDNFLFRPVQVYFLFYPSRVTNSASKNRAYDNIFNDSIMNLYSSMQKNIL